MAVDPIIARGIEAPDLTRPLLLAEEIKNRRQYNSLLEVGQQFRQQQYADEQRAAQQQQQQAAEAAERERQKQAELEDIGQTYQLLLSGDPSAIEYAFINAPQQYRELRKRNPEAATTALRGWMEQVLGVKQGETGIKVGQYNPGDYTPESFAQFLQTQDPSGLRRQYAPAQPAMTVINGVPTVVDKATATARPLSTLDSEANAAATLEGAKVTGREEATKASEAPQRIARARSNIQGYENTVAAIDRADKLASGWTTGIMSKADVVPGTPQYDLKAELVTIMANIGFDRLQRMRDESPTGGALGQVAIQELTALQNSIANLDRAQSTDQFRTNLKVVRGRYAQFKRAQERAIAQEEARLKGGSAATKEDPLGIR